MPKALTLDMSSAAQWYRSQMAQIGQMVDKTAPLAVQIQQAEKLQGLLLKAAEHSLGDPAMASNLREAFLRPGIEGLAQRLGGVDGLSGTALQQKMLDELTAPVDKTRRWFEQGACFAKGTLVHTKEGLKPIEQIQVGDWVLSKPENGGEQAYKRVLKTFAHEPQRVVELCYYKPTNKPSQRPGNVARITVTVNHPVWTKERGWTAVDGLRSIEDSLPHFEDRDGDDVKFSYIKNIYLSDQQNVGWMSNNWPENVSVNKGSLWDYAEHRLVASSEFPPDDIAEGERPDPYFKAPVYNLEVEDFHTYYVGEHGIWVHNQNCDGWNLEVRNTIHPVESINQVSAFTTRLELKNVLAARGVDKGIYLLRAHSNSQLQELVDADKRIANWLKHEEAVPGRLVSNNTGERYGYAVQSAPDPVSPRSAPKTGLDPRL